MFTVASNPEALASMDSKQKTCRVRLSIVRLEFFSCLLPFERFYRGWKMILDS